MPRKLCLYSLLTLLALLCSCGPARDILYVQDLPENVPIPIQKDGDIRLEPGDRLQIDIHSRDQEMYSAFNITSDQVYTVDEFGRIDMPILGILDVEGLTRLEVAQMIKYRLLAGALLRDPIVTVTFPEMCYYTIGERAGRYEFKRDKVTILEALSEMGDLPMTAKRTNVMVLRTEGDNQVAYRVDLTKTDDVYSSPVYYLRQNDIIYIEPTQLKQDTSKAYGSSYMQLGFWVGLLGTVTSLITLFTK